MLTRKESEDVKSLIKLIKLQKPEKLLDTFIRLKEKSKFKKVAESSHDLANALLNRVDHAHRFELAQKLARTPKLIIGREMGIRLRVSDIIGDDALKLAIEKQQKLSSYAKNIMRDIKNTPEDKILELAQTLVSNEYDKKTVVKHLPISHALLDNCERSARVEVAETLAEAHGRFSEQSYLKTSLEAVLGRRLAIKTDVLKRRFFNKRATIRSQGNPFPIIG